MGKPAHVEGVMSLIILFAQVASESIADYHTHMEAVDYPRALEAVWTLSHVPPNTSMRQPHGSWLRMKSTVTNWRHEPLGSQPSCRSSHD